MVLPAKPVRPQLGRPRDEPGRSGLIPMRTPLWQRVVEPYAAGLVLEDLAGRSDDPVACLRILSRYAVTRTVLLVLAAELSGAALRIEAAIANHHLARLAAADAERRALRRLLRAGTAGPPSLRLVRCAMRAAALAAAARHEAGAFRLHHLGYSVALTGAWRAEAAAAARSIAHSADLADAGRAARVWRDRADRLDGACIS